MTALVQVREGMEVYGAAEAFVGRVDARDEHALRANDLTIPHDAIDSIIKRHIYLTAPAAAYQAATPAAVSAAQR